MSTSPGYMSTHSEKLHAAAPTAATAVAGDTVTVSLRMLNGAEFEVVMRREDTVRDLAARIRTTLSIPIAVQHLIYDNQVLKEPAERLSNIFPGCKADIAVIRRPYTAQERGELFQRLVRATGAGNISQVRELLKEGAPLDCSATQEGQDTSVCLDHWGSDESASQEEEKQEEPKEAEAKRQKTDDDLEDMEDSGGSEMDESDRQSQSQESDMEDHKEVCLEVCGGLTPLFMAIATGSEELARDFRQLGAKELDLTPSCELGEAWASHPPKVLEIARHLVAGVDPDTKLMRGQGIRATESGTMLHACAANHRLPGMYELAQLLIKKQSNLDAGDSEGDTPLAHARYFDAPDLYKLYSGHGASVAGPFYSRWNGGPAALYQHLGPILALGRQQLRQDDEE